MLRQIRSINPVLLNWKNIAGQTDIKFVPFTESGNPGTTLEMEKEDLSENMAINNLLRTEEAFKGVAINVSAKIRCSIVHLNLKRG